MKIYLASDHAGFELKGKIRSYLGANYEVVDLGPFELNKDDDYPDFIRPAAEAVAKDPDNSRAVIMGGGGQGEAMVANRVTGVRAVVFYGPRAPITTADIAGRASLDPYEQIRLSREHNNANILSFGARFVAEEEAQIATKIFLETAFSDDERHKRRINKY